MNERSLEWDERRRCRATHYFSVESLGSLKGLIHILCSRKHAYRQINQRDYPKQQLLQSSSKIVSIYCPYWPTLPPNQLCCPEVCRGNRSRGIGLRTFDTERLHLVSRILSFLCCKFDAQVIADASKLSPQQWLSLRYFALSS